MRANVIVACKQKPTDGCPWACIDSQCFIVALLGRIMPDHERAMLAYCKLAELSQQKRQLPGRDKFLVLAGAAACRAGWPEIAARCRSLILANNPAHQISRFGTFADALRDPGFGSLLKSRQRFCTYERAEHILQELAVDLDQPSDAPAMTAGEQAGSFLSHCS